MIEVLLLQLTNEPWKNYFYALCNNKFILFYNTTAYTYAKIGIKSCRAERMFIVFYLSMYTYTNKL